MLNNALHLISTESFFWFDWFDTAGLHTLINRVLVALGVASFPIDKAQRLRKVSLASTTVELTTGYFELNGLTTNRQVSNQNRSILVQSLAGLWAMGALTPLAEKSQL
jgi:hypothetical protein